MAEAYLDAAAASKSGCLHVLERLALENVCPRCALRHVNVRGQVYAAEAPSQAEFLDAVRRKMRSEAEAAAAAEPAAEDAGPEPSASSAPAGAKLCPACWGILQALDGKTPGWSFQRIADAVKAEGFAFTKYSLELLIPPFIAVRQVSVAWELVRLLPTDTQVAEIAHSGAPDLVEKRLGVVSVKEALKLALHKALSERLQAEHEVEGPLTVTLSFCHEENSAETGFLNLKYVPQGNQAGSRRRGGHWSKRQKTEGQAEPLVQGELYQQASKALAALHNEKILALCRPPLVGPAEPADLDVTVSRQAVYIGGYYTKEARGMCQSPWLVDGGGTSLGLGKSVQETMEVFLVPALKADACKFMSAGREDMDVRMLGSGRPFAFEVQNQRSGPPSPEECAAIEAALAAADAGVTIRSLQPVTKAQRDMLIEGDGEKDKEYRALCVFARPLTPEDVAKLHAIRDLEIQQKTPVRVLHRRAALTRPRLINWLKVELVPGSPKCAIIDMRCQAGTYVKEFVHGDFGRTRPSLGSLLGCQSDILQLDVTAVNLAFV